MLKTTVALAAVLAATPALAQIVTHPGTPEQEASWRTKCIDYEQQQQKNSGTSYLPINQQHVEFCILGYRSIEVQKEKQQQAVEDHRRLMEEENQQLLLQAERDRQAAETARQSAERLRQATEAARTAAEQKAQQERQAAAAQAALKRTIEEAKQKAAAQEAEQRMAAEAARRAAAVRAQAEEAAKPENQILSAYTLYVKTKYCNEIRQGYLVQLVNDAELDRATTVVGAVVKKAKTADPSIDTDAIWANARNAAIGFSATEGSCRGSLGQIMSISPVDPYNIQKPF
jgi:membrane protein involved in colicin uptake